MPTQTTTEPELLDILAAHFTLAEGRSYARDWHAAAPGIMARIEPVGTAGGFLASGRAVPVLFAALRRPNNSWGFVAVTRRTVFGRLHHTLHWRKLDGAKWALPEKRPLPEGRDLTRPFFIRCDKAHRWLSWSPSLTTPKRRRPYPPAATTYFIYVPTVARPVERDVSVTCNSVLGWDGAPWHSRPVLPYAPVSRDEVFLQRPDGAVVSLHDGCLYETLNCAKSVLLYAAQAEWDYLHLYEAD
jgi:hypothetical protein